MSGCTMQGQPYISRMNLARQREMVRARAIDPRWLEVILGVFWRNRRPNDVAALLDSVNSTLTWRPTTSIAES